MSTATAPYPPVQRQDGAVVYPIVEQYYTLQGEGYWAGSAAYFIRLAGCDVGCPWCDTKESWDVAPHPVQTVADLVTAVEAAGARVVVITGGEPAMHHLTALTGALRDAGCRVHLETSGAYPIHGTFDWITLSPKKFKPPVPSSYGQVDELKVVVFNQSDFAWAETHAALCAPETALYLQPEWSRTQMIPHIIAYVKAHPQWRISVQTHKYLNIP